MSPPVKRAERTARTTRITPHVAPLNAARTAQRRLSQMWWWASLPAVEGGILPSGKNARNVNGSMITVIFSIIALSRRAGSHGSTSAKMADATVLRQSQPVLRSGAAEGGRAVPTSVDVPCPVDGRSIFFLSAKLVLAYIPGKSEAPCAIFLDFLRYG